jgi:hypothetical protein
MQPVLIVAVCLHVLSATAWAGFSFAMARTAGANVERLIRPQLGAAVVAVLSGGWFWSLSHAGAFGTPEKVLALGVVAALLALLVQAATALPASRALARSPEAQAPRRRAAVGQRIGAGLIALTLVCMASARFV